MSSDRIVEEIHRIREEYAAEHGYSLKAIYEDLKVREEKGEYVTVCRSPRPPRVSPTKDRGVAGAAAEQTEEPR